MDSPLSALESFVKVLNSLNINYLLGGSFASSIQGDFRSTNDLDFLCHVPSEAITSFVQLLQKEFIVDDVAVTQALLTRKTFNIFHEESFMKIDVFTQIGIFEKQQLERAVLVDIPGCSEQVKVCSPEDIIIAKIRWYCLGGKTSERQLNDISGVLKVQIKLDYEYITNWCNALGLTEVWESIRTL